jgi:hypothetical protein
MTAKRSGHQGRVVRPRRQFALPVAPLAEIDRRVLGVLCTHRVVTQAQLGRLFPGIPERTLRYRTRRLHELGLAGRSRPYREQGSAPNHHWPTRRADCLMRGEPTPRGGERSRPNPIFLAHAAALTELYVALETEADHAGLAVQEYRREGDAREPFDSAGKKRALAPDAMVILADARGRKFGAFVEIDLGTMSHTRLRQKAELPSAFLAESIHEMFDEYYSVSLSFWTRSGLREKARQGHLVGNLPWGYVRDPATKLAVPDQERAALVREMFERYATGQESDRSLADWLNAKGARTARDRQFSKDTVREMLCNAAYAGYVSGLRDKTRSIQGLHEAVVTDELFEKVQEIRSWRTRVVKPGHPSEEYLLRKLLCCERCGARMHGTRGSRAGIRRYQCSTRRHHGNCTQAIVKAEPLEDQLVAWLHAFQPDAKLRDLVLDTIRAATQQRPGDDQERRRDLLTQLDRLQDLYVLGDLTKPRYIMRRQTVEEELQRLAPPADPDLDRAQELLGDFARFWHAEPNPAERRKLLGSLFDHVWQDNGTIVAVKPRPAFARYFKAIDQARPKHPKPTGNAG